MKFRRFCTVFLLLVLLLTQLLPVTAYGVEDIQIQARSALLVDGTTGTVLLDQDAHTKQYPASITKVMTALLVFEAIDRGELRLSDPITASANSVAGLPDDASTADIVAGETLTVGDLSLDTQQRVAIRDGKTIDLTAKEYDLLELLMKNPRRVYSRESLMDLVWGYSYAGDYRTVDVHVRRLREKLERVPAEPAYIMTKWGVGYYFQGENQPTI